MKQFIKITVFMAVFTVGVVIVSRVLEDRRNEKLAPVIAAAEDLGCTYIEQSYHHPENYYIDCGNDEIRIIKVEK